ncbi:MAG: hypothetical protein AAF718_09410 [Pseudomonadota bacterium]
MMGRAVRATAGGISLAFDHRALDGACGRFAHRNMPRN